jgi:hypothetical protein
VATVRPAKSHGPVDHGHDRLGLRQNRDTHLIAYAGCDLQIHLASARALVEGSFRPAALGTAAEAAGFSPKIVQASDGRSGRQ